MSRKRSIQIALTLAGVFLVFDSTCPASAQSFNTFTQTQITSSYTAKCGPNYTVHKSVCTADGVDAEGNPEGGAATAVSGYGALRASVSAYVEAYVAESGTLWEAASANAGSNDTVTFVGLSTPAYLWIQGNLLWKPNGPQDLGTAEYIISAGGVPDCLINNLTIDVCVIQVPITPSVSLRIQRVLTATAIASLTDFPSGTYDKNALILGYPPPGGATMRLSVRDAAEHLIKGVSVVGASGHVYRIQ